LKKDTSHILIRTLKRRRKSKNRKSAAEAALVTILSPTLKTKTQTLNIESKNVDGGVTTKVAGRSGGDSTNRTGCTVGPTTGRQRESPNSAERRRGRK